MAYEDAVRLPNGAWFDLGLFRSRVVALGTTPAGTVPPDGRLALASGQTVDVENLVARLNAADGQTPAGDDGLHGIKLLNGNVYNAQTLNARLMARDGGTTCFLPRIGARLSPLPDFVKISGVPGDSVTPPVPGGPPPGFSYLLGADGNRLLGADGANLYGVA